MNWTAHGVLVSLLFSAQAAHPQEAEFPKPGKNHEMLKRFQGTWEVLGKYWIEADKAIEYKLVETGTLSCNGLWLIYTDKGVMQGKPYDGHGTLGYDERKKKFVGTWVDSANTQIDVGEGVFDEQGKVFTYVSTISDDDGKPVRIKRVTEIKSDDLQIMTVYTGPEGKEEVTGKVEYRRKKP